MGVGGLDEENSDFLVGFSGGWVNTGKPRLGFRAVADISGIDIKGCQVAFGIGEVVRGYVSDNDAISIIWERNNSGCVRKAEYKTSGDS